MMKRYMIRMLREAQVTEPRQLNERALLLVLAAIQFTATVDFLIILPLGPQYMRVFNINPGQFGLIVSAYAVAAGLSGVTTGVFLDRFDRKQALLWLYFGFTIGTLLCAVAPTYLMLILARAVAGAFGGVAGAFVLAIIGDVVPEARRGRAMGLVMSSFSVASICGVPLGLLLASHISWHVPFLALAAINLLVLAAAARVLPPLRGHLAQMHDAHPVARMLAVLAEPDHRTAFVFMAVLTFTGFLIFPNLANYMVLNVGLTEKQLPLIYLCGGLCTVFTMNWIGRWADLSGKPRVFTIMSLCSLVPILWLTNLPRVPLSEAIGVSTLLMICMSGRFVPAMAMMTASVEARYRGGFMSMNSSVQQLASGLAAFVSGHLLGQAPGGQITHYPLIGVISASCALVCIYMARFLKSAERAPGLVDALPAAG
jgi:predicted MFS family arabinose efflux permease